MTLKDSSTEKKGKIVASQDYTAASYNGSLIEIAGEDASMTMESGNISAVRKTPNSNGQYGVGVTDGGDFTMTGGKIEAGWLQWQATAITRRRTPSSTSQTENSFLLLTMQSICPNPAQRPSVAARFMVPQEVYASNEAL